MGCDIHSFAEVRNTETNKWEKVGDHFLLDDFDKEWFKKERGESPFSMRDYSIFAFLAGVRNYDRCEPLSEPKGLPDNLSYEIKNEYERWNYDAHSASFLTLKELLDFDYDKTFWNRRVTKQVAPNHWNGASLAEEGEGKVLTYRETLWGWFIVPTFTMQPITLIQAIGISFFINYLKMNIGKQNDDGFSMVFVLEVLVRSVLAALFILGSGWVITLFI